MSWTVDDLLTNPIFWAGAVVAALVVVVGSGPLARRFHTSRSAAALTIGAVAAVVLLTAPIIRPGALFAPGRVWDWGRAARWITSGWAEVHPLDLGLEGWLNVALFAPAGYLVARLTGRPVATMAGLVVYSFLAETVQAGFLIRVADPRDLYANTLGAAIGVITVAAVVGFDRQQRPVA